MRWGSTLVVARLLRPEDYGIVGMATVALGLIQLVNEFGVSTAIVQQRDLDDDTVARLGGFSVLLGLVLAVVGALAAPLVGKFFGEPAAGAALAALSVTFLFRALQVVPRGLLTRDLRFRDLALVEGAESILQAVIVLVLAMLGWGYWSLVLASIAAAIGSAAGLVAVRRHRLAWPLPARSIAAPLTLGAHLVVTRTTWFLFSNADFAVVGRLLGKVALGAYTIGWTVASIPVERVTSLVGRVTPAIFSAVQSSRAELRRYLLLLLEGLALLTFPASVGLSLVAEEFVHVVLGSGWEAAIAPLRLLSFYGGVRSITTLFPQILVATGQSRRAMQTGVVMALILPVAFIIGARWGTVGVAAAWVIVYPIVLLPFVVRYTLPAIDASLAHLLRALWPAFSASAVMSASVIGVRAAGVDSLPLTLRLAVLVGTGAFAYVAAVMVLHRSRLVRYREALALVRK